MRILIAGGLFGLFLAALRGDFWPTALVEGLLFAALLGGLWLVSVLMRRYTNRNAKASQ